MTEKLAREMLKFYTYMTDAMGQMLEQMEDDQMVLGVKKMVEYYINQYNNIKEQEDGKTAAYNMHRLLDNVHNEMIQKGADTPVSCKKGCGFCCFQKVDITEDEADLIKHYCDENNIEINYDILNLQKGLNSKEMIALDLKSRKCIFLDKDLSCKIHEHRPSMCRAMISVDDPNNCDNEKNPGGKMLRLNAPHPEAIVISMHMASKSNGMAEQLLKLKQ